MNRTRELGAAAVVGGKIFVCGGYAGRIQIAAVEYYDAELSRWTDCAPLPRPAGYPIAYVYGSYLITSGASCRVLRKHSGDVWCMDVGESNPRWRNVLSTPRRIWYAATFGGKLVVVGPLLNVNDRRQSVGIFDGQTWSSGPDLPLLNYFSETTPISDNFAEKLLEQ